jgi:hypothetical protein
MRQDADGISGPAEELSIKQKNPKYFYEKHGASVA